MEKGTLKYHEVWADRWASLSALAMWALVYTLIGENITESYGRDIIPEYLEWYAPYAAALALVVTLAFGVRHHLLWDRVYDEERSGIA